MPYDANYFDLAERGQPLPWPGQAASGRRLYRHSPADTLGEAYAYEPSLVLAINLAFATGRPLLLAGEPGCGKTSVARNIALFLGCAYYQHTMSSRSQADELLYTVDTLRRLNEAQARQRLRDEAHFTQPGVLWWALAPGSAARRGLPVGARDVTTATPPPGHRPTGDAVVLIDEIDKCEPDVPNDLLEVLDARRFTVGGRPVATEGVRAHVLVVITTNVERDLPGAFVRRCVTYRFPDAADGWFAALGAERFPTLPEATLATLETRLRAHRRIARERGERPPGTAEYLDAARALQALNLQAGQDTQGLDALAQLESCIFGKQATLDAGGAR